MKKTVFSIFFTLFFTAVFPALADVNIGTTKIDYSWVGSTKINTIQEGITNITPGPAYTPLGDIISSCVFDVDSTIAASFPGSGQRFYNIEPTPADGSAQGGDDFQLGTTTAPSSTDPVFTGTAGSPSAYFALDSTQVFRVWNNTNTTFMNNLPKTTGGSLPVTFAIAFRAVDAANTKTLIGNSGSGASPNLRISQNAGESVFASISDGTNTSNTTGTALSVGTDYLVIFSIDAAGNVTRWINGVKNAALTFTPPTNTTNGGPFRIAETGGAARVYAVSMFNTAITDDQAAAIRGMYRIRHGRSY